MALTLLRHAPLPAYYHGRYNGWTDISIDTEAFEEEKVALLQRQHFDTIYASTLKRTQETLEQMGIQAYQCDARLDEVRFKAHIEGLNFEEISKLPSFDESLLDSKELWHHYVCAERMEHFKARTYDFLESLPKEKEILICAHAGTIKMLLEHLGLNRSHIEYLEFIRIEHGI